ncbi:MAG: hypothetical protein IJM81_00700 [Prevotella sp.]|nr:hypothetical protein [Prevotella sp.]
MESSVIFSAKRFDAGCGIGAAVARLTTWVCRGAEELRRYYSGIFEREIDNRQMGHLLHVQVAFLFAAFPTDGPLLLRTVCCGWFVWALVKCREALKN